MRRRALALLPLLLAASVASADDTRRSGLQFMGPALRALQRDDAQNPAMLWVQDGDQLWRAPTGPGGKRCADCHGDAPRSMAGVAARYPAWDAARGGALNLAGRINACRQQHQQAAPLPTEHADLLALSAYLGLQSRGQPVSPPADAGLVALRKQGQVLWQAAAGADQPGLPALP